MRIMVVTPYLPHRRVGHGGGTAVRDLITWLGEGQPPVLEMADFAQKRIVP